MIIDRDHVWEHKTFSTYLQYEKEIEEELNFWGRDGWELVAVVPTKPDPARVYFLKRMVPR